MKLRYIVLALVVPCVGVVWNWGEFSGSPHYLHEGKDHSGITALCPSMLVINELDQFDV